MPTIEAGTVEAELLLDIAGFVRNAAKAQNETRKMAGGLASLGTAIKAIGFGLIAREAARFGVSAAKAADDAAQAAELTAATFGRATGVIEDFVGEIARATGRSAVEVRGFATQLGVVATAMTGSQEEGAALSARLTRLALDTAAFRNLQAPEVINAFRGALLGQSRAALQLGIRLDETSLNAAALQLGFKKQFSELTRGQQTQVRASILTKALAQAQGEAARDAATLEGRLIALDGASRDLKVAVGNVLKPALAALAGGLQDSARSAADAENGIRILVNVALQPLLVAMQLAVSLAAQFSAFYLKVEAVAAQVASAIIRAFSAVIKVQADVVQAIADASAKIPKIGAAVSAAVSTVGSGLRVVADGGKAVADSLSEAAGRSGAAQDDVEEFYGAIFTRVQAVRNALLEQRQAAVDASKETAGAGARPEIKVDAAAQEALKKFREEAQSAAKAIAKDLGPALQIDATNIEEARAALHQIQIDMLALSEQSKLAGANVDLLNSKFESLTEQRDALNAFIVEQNQLLDEQREKFVSTGTAIGESLGAAFGDITAGAASAGKALEGFAKSVLDTALQAVQASLIQALAGQAGFIFSTIPPPASFAVAAAAAAAVAAVFAGIRGAVAGFAQGGLVRGGTPGRDSVPALLTPGEVVLPVPLVRSIMGLVGSPSHGPMQAGGMAAAGGGTQINLRVETVAPLTNVDVDNLINRRLLPALRRARSRGAF